ncbi:response regulator transcription factor [Oscillochloris sp. ZM17-4]|uniref:response regulator transcription factor n=1 Tax=Oscillochloris sp. ZM17-4 TaxID=2866714 RepID=UPI001C73211B|nr:response regulator transcription factor [Oscillochloris sp. ZM17-4]MBX0327889.1 response regulator transcription factor [Oscillochloris sp. ZM17-4]
MQRILIVDDEPAIVAAIRERLEREGLAVQSVGSGEAALAAVAERLPDLLLLDVGLPGIDGFEVLRRLRERGQEAPVILLTARGDEIDRVVGLELGADDYVVKPFSVRELAARARALLRRSAEVAALRARLAETSPTPPAAARRLEIDQPRRRAAFQGAALDLRPREFELLAFLARSPGQVFSRDALLRHVWGQEDYLDARTVDVHIRRLRAKIAEVNPEADIIQTEWGVGYRLSE